MRHVPGAHGFQLQLGWSTSPGSSVHADVPHSLTHAMAFGRQEGGPQRNEKPLLQPTSSEAFAASQSALEVQPRKPAQSALGAPAGSLLTMRRGASPGASCR